MKNSIKKRITVVAKSLEKLALPSNIEELKADTAQKLTKALTALAEGQLTLPATKEQIKTIESLVHTLSVLSLKSALKAEGATV
jgi:hypothetical protein